ncbi:MAG TPA: helix-turn-helix domain-containing protein [Solirubrobacteraceae bacterium]|nr:helix-turn-helix domain-containing protein [Solirubrobacteraceae bacterium]
MPERLPPSLAAALRPVLPELADATVAAIGREVPEYARPVEGPFGRGLRTGVEAALARFVDGIEQPGRPDERERAIYVALGRGEFRAGRSLDALLAAYRLGARLAWERFVAAGAAAGHEAGTLYRLASAIFSYIDAISAESVEGFAQERAAAESERQRRRRALVRMLAREDVPAAEARDLAALAAWPWPAALAALVASTDEADRLARRLGGEAIAAAEDEGLVVAFLPDPHAPLWRAQLETALDGAPAALGPAAPPERAWHSLRRARAAHALLAAGRIPGDGLAIAEEHLPALLLHGGDGALAADIAARALAPLDALTPARRARLLETLRAWLDNPGQVQRVAAELHVHPQTVRYRVTQLRELLGDALDDAERRFELALAVRA